MSCGTGSTDIGFFGHSGACAFHSFCIGRGGTRGNKWPGWRSEGSPPAWRSDTPESLAYSPVESRSLYPRALWSWCPGIDIIGLLQNRFCAVLMYCHIHNEDKSSNLNNKKTNFRLSDQDFRLNMGFNNSKICSVWSWCRSHQVCCVFFYISTVFIQLWFS